MKTLLTIAAVLALAGASLARSPVACGPDCLGMTFWVGDSYFPCLTLHSGNVTIDLVLMDATETSGISAWECHVDYDLPPDVVYVGWTLAGSAINISTPPDFVVGMSMPLPYSEEIVLASLQLLVLDGGCASFYTRAADDPTIPGTPAYIPARDPGVIVPLNTGSTGLWGEPALLNCICAIPVEGTTWGTVKSVYR